MELTTKTVQIMARLDAVEQMITRIAAESIPLENALRVHLQAHDIAEQLLISCGLQLEQSIEDDFDVRHETDELLKLAVVAKPRAEHKRESAPTIHAKSQEPIEVGPECAADPGLRLPTDDSRNYAQTRARKPLALTHHCFFENDANPRVSRVLAVVTHWSFRRNRRCGFKEVG